MAYTNVQMISSNAAIRTAVFEDPRIVVMIKSKIYVHSYASFVLLKSGFTDALRVDPSPSCGRFQGRRGLHCVKS